MKKALLINAHQYYEGISSGNLNKAILAFIKDEMTQRGYEIQETHIEEGYEIDKEIQKHLWADIIILQTPVYWFSTPWIYKKYADEVFTAAMIQGSFLSGDGRTRTDPTKQYGTGGLMHGKQYMMSLTWNAPREAFGDKAQLLFEGQTVDEIFAHNTANYKFCGVEILSSFSCFNVVKAPDFDNYVVGLRAHLSGIFV